MKVLIILSFSTLVFCFYAVSANPLPSERSADGAPKSCSRHDAHHVLSREVKGAKEGAKEERKRTGDPDDLMDIFRSFSKKDIDKARDIMKNVRRLVDIVDDIASKDDGTMLNYASKALRTFEHFNDMKSFPGMDNFLNFFTSGGEKRDGKDKKMEDEGNFFANMLNKFKTN